MEKMLVDDFKTCQYYWSSQVEMEHKQIKNTHSWWTLHKCIRMYGKTMSRPYVQFLSYSSSLQGWSSRRDAELNSQHMPIALKPCPPVHTKNSWDLWTFTSENYIWYIYIYIYKFWSIAISTIAWASFHHLCFLLTGTRFRSSQLCWPGWPLVVPRWLPLLNLLFEGVSCMGNAAKNLSEMPFTSSRLLWKLWAAIPGASWVWKRTIYSWFSQP